VSLPKLILPLLLALSAVIHTAAWAADDTITRTELAQALANKSRPYILDVRSPWDYAAGHVPGAINIPFSILSQHLSEMPKDEPVVVYCESGAAADRAARLLTQAGRNPLRLEGDMSGWRAAGLPLETVSAQKDPE
jgi:rhodanese-related sulfurtransferase